MLGVPHSLAALRKLGYKTFSKWIDESYDDIDNFNLRFKAVFAETKRLCALSDDQWIEMIHEMIPVLEHNHTHFIKHRYNRRITKNALTYFKETDT